MAARVVAAEAALAAGAPADAAELARQALDRDPYEEGAIRVLVTAVAATGRPAAALVAYAAAAGRLRDELGVDPAPETEAAYLAVLRADVPTAEVPGGPAAGAPADLPGRAGAWPPWTPLSARPSGGPPRSSRWSRARRGSERPGCWTPGPPPRRPAA